MIVSLLLNSFSTLMCELQIKKIIEICDLVNGYTSNFKFTELNRKLNLKL